VNSRFYPDRGSDPLFDLSTVRDTSWEPLVDPLQPEYPYAHCINSGAERAVLEAEFETGPNPLTMTSPTAPGVTHKWRNIGHMLRKFPLRELAWQNYLKPVQSLPSSAEGP
jgi:hypothetical protein